MATTADKSACRNACVPSDACNTLGPGGYRCSLNPGHSQATHVACGDGPDRHQLATWED